MDSAKYLCFALPKEFLNDYGSIFTKKYDFDRRLRKIEDYTNCFIWKSLLTMNLGFSEGLFIVVEIFFCVDGKPQTCMKLLRELFVSMNRISRCRQKWNPYFLRYETLPQKVYDPMYLRFKSVFLTFLKGSIKPSAEDNHILLENFNQIFHDHGVKEITLEELYDAINDVMTITSQPLRLKRSSFIDYVCKKFYYNHDLLKNFLKDLIDTDLCNIDKLWSSIYDLMNECRDKEESEALESKKPNYFRKRILDLKKFKGYWIQYRNSYELLSKLKFSSLIKICKDFHRSERNLISEILILNKLTVSNEKRDTNRSIRDIIQSVKNTILNYSETSKDIRETDLDLLLLFSFKYPAELLHEIHAIIFDVCESTTKHKYQTFRTGLSLVDDIDKNTILDYDSEDFDEIDRQRSKIINNEAWLGLDPLYPNVSIRGKKGFKPKDYASNRNKRTGSNINFKSVSKQKNAERRSRTQSRSSTAKQRSGSRSVRKSQVRERSGSRSVRKSQVRERSGSRSVRKSQVRERSGSRSVRKSQVRERSGSRSRKSQVRERSGSRSRKSQVRERSGSRSRKSQVRERSGSRSVRKSQVRERSGSRSVRKSQVRERSGSRSARKSQVRERSGSRSRKSQVRERSGSRSERESQVRERSGSQLARESQVRERSGSRSARESELRDRGSQLARKSDDSRSQREGTTGNVRKGQVKEKSSSKPAKMNADGKSTIDNFDNLKRAKNLENSLVTSSNKPGDVKDRKDNYKIGDEVLEIESKESNIKGHNKDKSKQESQKRMDKSGKKTGKINSKNLASVSANSSDSNEVKINTIKQLDIPKDNIGKSKQGNSQQRQSTMGDSNLKKKKNKSGNEKNKTLPTNGVEKGPTSTVPPIEIISDHENEISHQQKQKNDVKNKNRLHTDLDIKPALTISRSEEYSAKHQVVCRNSGSQTGYPNLKLMSGAMSSRSFDSKTSGLIDSKKLNVRNSRNQTHLYNVDRKMFKSVQSKEDYEIERSRESGDITSISKPTPKECKNTRMQTKFGVPKFVRKTAASKYLMNDNNKTQYCGVHNHDKKTMPENDSIYKTLRDIKSLNVLTSEGMKSFTDESSGPEAFSNGDFYSKEISDISNNDVTNNDTTELTCQEKVVTSPHEYNCIYRSNISTECFTSHPLRRRFIRIENESYFCELLNKKSGYVDSGEKFIRKECYDNLNKMKKVIASVFQQ